MADVAAEKQRRSRNQVLGEEEQGAHIYRMGAFCPRSWLHPGQKVFLGGPEKFPARGPPLVPGGSTTRDKRGPFSLISAKSYVCFCFFLLLFLK